MKVFDTLEGINLARASTSVALGLFDGLHIGHRRVIGAAVEGARARGLTPCVFTFTLGLGAPPGKDGEALLTHGHFEALLEEMGVEYIFRPDFAEFRDLSPEAFVREMMMGRLGAAYLACGENFHFGKGAAGKAGDIARLMGGEGEAVVLPLVIAGEAPASSTRIRACVRQGDIPTATAMLGRRFAIDFPVVHGKALGRTLGTPTINQPFPDGFVVPRFGVYATVVTLNGTCHAAVTNVGRKPTVGSDGVLAETYIHGFSGDLYGKAVTVEFLSFIRPEKKFSGIEALREQILRDSGEASRIVEEYLKNH